MTWADGDMDGDLDADMDTDTDVVVLNDCFPSQIEDWSTACEGLESGYSGSYYDDIEPSYLPDGDIVFVSSRCSAFIQ
mgnify:CR=1 FL=1